MKSLKAIYQTKTAKLHLQNQVYKAKCFRSEEINMLNQINSIKPTKLSHPTKLPNKI